MSKKKPTETAAQADLKKSKIDVQAATLVGTVRDDILGIFKNHGDWKKIPEGKQRDIAHAAEQLSKEVVRKAAEIVAGRGFQSIHGTLESVTVKDGLKMVVKASKMVESRRELMDHQGGGITIVLSDISPYTTQRSETEIDLDQPSLPIDEEVEIVHEKKSRKKKANS